MATEVKLPQLGQTMEEGTIVSCLVKVGDKVGKGDVLFEIETDKATLEMESPASGFVKHILVEAGQTLPVGDALLVLGDKAEDVSQSFIDSLKAGVVGVTAEAPPQPSTVEAAAPPAQPSEPASAEQRVKASPRAKRLAKDMGVDLTTVQGTGPAGRITEQDIKQAAGPKPTGPVVTQVKLGATIPVNRLQKITGEKMLQSKREIPCFYLTVKVDVTDLVALRTKLNETGDVKLAYNDFIIRAVAMGLEKYAIMTGQLEGDVIKLAETINVGLAISVPDGLVAPVVKDADKKNVTDIARATQDLITRARDNKLALDDLTDGCITVSNLGAFGISSFIPIVVPGQASILGIGRIADTCMPDNGNIMIRKLMSMTLSVDHKVATGAEAAQFLDFVRKTLEDTSNFT